MYNNLPCGCCDDDPKAPWNLPDEDYCHNCTFEAVNCICICGLCESQWLHNNYNLECEECCLSYDNRYMNDFEKSDIISEFRYKDNCMNEIIATQQVKQVQQPIEPALSISAEVQLAKRIRRLSKQKRTIILQLLNKCEYLHSKEILNEHIKNAQSLITYNHTNVAKLPAVKKQYLFINKATQEKLTLTELAHKLNKSESMIYKSIYRKNKIFMNQYCVIRG